VGLPSEYRWSGESGRGGSDDDLVVSRSIARRQAIGNLFGGDIDLQIAFIRLDERTLLK
jgi:hypothetical protein